MFIQTPPTGFSRALSLVSPPNFSEICDMHELPWFAVLGILSHDRNAASPRLYMLQSDKGPKRVQLMDFLKKSAKKR